MNLTTLFADKSIKAKAKVAEVGNRLLNGELPVEELLLFAATQKASIKASCIEALEYATKQTPGIADERVLTFVTNALKEDEPRLKWESAKVIGNTATLFAAQLDQPIRNLLPNAEHSGTVVRWATAWALAEILKLKTGHNKVLIPKIEQLCHNEANSGVKKKYLDALKKISKEAPPHFNKGIGITPCTSSFSLTTKSGLPASGL